MYKYLAPCLIVICFNLNAQNSPFWNVELKATNFSDRIVPPANYQTYSLHIEDLKAELQGLLADGSLNLAFPVGENHFETFKVYETSNMAPELALKYPSIKSYKGQSKKGSSIRFDLSEKGLKAIINRLGENTILIEPTNAIADQYMIFRTKDIQLPAGMEHQGCISKELNNEQSPSTANHNNNFQRGAPSDLVTYQTAIATTFEFSQDKGGTLSSVMAELNTIVNRINQVMIREVGIQLELVANNDTLIFLDADDPYSNGDLPELLVENQSTINRRIGFSSYDIGHVFGTNGGGLARLGSVCDLFKARGTSNTFGAFADFYFYVLVCHEIGHQLDATHTFNFCEEGNASNATESTAYEPGAGSTIMCYSGASSCSNRWLQSRNDDYYHTNSLERIYNFTRSGNGADCGSNESISNNTPDINLNYIDGFVIPKGTPFKLQGEATDSENDPLTYCWEQYNLGPVSPLGNPIENAPAFRSFEPIPFNDRIFPRMADLISNTNNDAESLTNQGRDFKFRLTVRDNNVDGGGFAISSVEFESITDAGPFQILNYNFGSRSFYENDTVPLFWSVANTDQSPISVSKVNILLSTDGGLTYPDTLMKNTDNDGEENLIMPIVSEDKLACRFLVEAVDNIFFNVNRADFEILKDVVSNDDLGDNSQVKLFPNPASQYIEISIADIPFNNVNVDIFNMQGQSLLQSQINQSISRIPISNLSNGIYFVKFEIDQKVYVKRFEILR